MEEEFSLVIFTQAQYLIPNLLKNVVQFISLRNGKKVRNWGILNSIWQIYRTDILTSAWQTIALIVDLINPLIGPKE